MKTLDVYRLGVMSYKNGMDLQLKLLEKRINNEVNDSFLLIEHPPTITIGRGGNRSNLIISESYLKSKNIEFFEVSRGGDITFHGPGQVVCYPIINLNDHVRDVHKYIRDLEKIIIEALKEFGIEGQVIEGLTGVWTKGCKIASIGVGIKRWVTYHGLAVNVNTDLDFFDLMIPCGINNVKMTSIEQCGDRGELVGTDLVSGVVAEKFIGKFGYTEVIEKEKRLFSYE